MKRVAVFVDGGRFFDGLHAQGFSIRLAYRRLFAMLSGESEECISGMSFYMARLPAGPYPNKLTAQQRYFDELGEQGISVIPGETEVRGGVFIEHGVEAALATDLVRGALARDFDAALLISRRAALARAVAAAVETGRPVNTAFFRYRIDPLDGLAEVASSTRAIESRHIIECTLDGHFPGGVHGPLGAG